MPLRSAGTRKALVIGNGNYNFLARVPAAEAGSLAMAKALHDLDFQVVEKHDLSLTPLRKLIEEQFIPDLQPGDVCLIYYSGYGLQRERLNYFVPVDFNPQVKDEAYGVAYSIDRLRDQLSSKQLSEVFFFLEASWDSPKLAAWTGAPGLAPQGGSAAGTVLLFDTGSGQSVPPPAGGMGLFSSALVRTLHPKPGLNLTEVIQNVETGVSQASDGRQQPYAVGVRTYEFIEAPAPTPEVRFVHDTGPKPGEAHDNKDRQEYVYIPGGRFLMGCVPASNPQCERNEKPQHPVEISHPFWLGQTEVEVQAYNRFTQAIGRKMPHDTPMWNAKFRQTNYPIVFVSWRDAQEYCAWAGGRPYLPKPNGNTPHGPASITRSILIPTSRLPGKSQLSRYVGQ